MIKIFCMFLIFIISSCNNLELIYKDKSNLLNPLYEKTDIQVSGVDLMFINSYTPMLFGDNKSKEFSLLINIEEKKTKRSVEKNQSTSNLRYELRFLYTLFFNEKNCITYEKEILSSFSIIPKSAGYNFGTDASLEKKYQLVVIDNLNQFISFLSGIDIYNCR